MARDYILEKGMPLSRDAEEAILGAIFLDNSAYDEAAEYLTGDEFSFDANRRIFQRMRELRESNRPVDMVLLIDILEKHKELEAVGGVAYLSGLIDGVPQRPSIKHYIEIVRRKAMLRGLINISQNAIAEAVEYAEDAEEVISRAELAITQLTEEVVDRKWATFADSLRQAGGLDGYINKVLDPAILTGIPTRYEQIDKIIGGLAPASLIILAARPSMGKTALAVNICDNITAVDPDVVAGVFSLEMSREAMERRFISSMSKINLREFSNRERSFQWDTDNRKITQAVEEFLGRRIFIDDSAYLTPMRLRSKCRQLKRREGRLDLVVVDYMQLMSGGQKFENRTQEVSAISRSLKALAKELGCPIVALSQLSRKTEDRSDKRPQLSDLRESGSIEQDADVIVFIHRPEVYSRDNPDLHGLAEVNIAKNRDGKTDTAHVAFIESYTRFENLAFS